MLKNIISYLLPKAPVWCSYYITWWV